MKYETESDGDNVGIAEPRQGIQREGAHPANVPSSSFYPIFDIFGACHVDRMCVVGWAWDACGMRVRPPSLPPSHPAFVFVFAFASSALPCNLPSSPPFQNHDVASCPSTLFPPSSLVSSPAYRVASRLAFWVCLLPGAYIWLALLRRLRRRRRMGMCCVVMRCDAI